MLADINGILKIHMPHAFKYVSTQCCFLFSVDSVWFNLCNAFALKNKLVVFPRLVPFTVLYAISTSHSQIHFPNVTFGIYR